MTVASPVAKARANRTSPLKWTTESPPTMQYALTVASPLNRRCIVVRNPRNIGFTGLVKSKNPTLLRKILLHDDVTHLSRRVGGRIN